MLSPDQIRLVLPALLGLPIVAAIILRFTCGRTARLTALSAVLALFGLTALIGASAMFEISDYSEPDAKRNLKEKQFGPVMVPRFVPGDPLADGKETGTTTWNVLTFGKPGSKTSTAVQFYIGLDGINLWLVALTAFMLIPVVLVSWDTIREREGAYYSWILLLAAGVMGVFLSFDLMLFYSCFELTLVPLLFLIGGWGFGPQRRDAARKLFLFTLAGGLFTLVGAVLVVLNTFDRTGELTFSLPRLAELTQNGLSAADATKRSIWQDTQTYIFIALAIGFLVKIPVVPLHTWLPGAYSEAPVGVTVMMSALLAKMGTFGLLRLCLPLAPDATLTLGMPLIGVLGAIGIVYGALAAYAQTDIRRVVAYSSISHLGFCAMAITAFNSYGLYGSVLHMVNHGLSTGAMFLLVGMLLRRYGSGRIADYSGIWHRLPEWTFLMMAACLASIGLPGLNNFVSEVIMLAGVVDMRNQNAAVAGFLAAAGAGIFLGAWYTLTVVRRVCFGPHQEPPTATGAVSDLSMRERLTVGPVVLMCLVLGLLPQTVLNVMKRDVDRLTQTAEEARARAGK